MTVGRGSLAAFLAILAASPVWILLTHVVLARVFRRPAPQVVAVGAGLAGAVPTAILAGTLALPESSLLARMPVEASYAAVVYVCLAYSYFHLFNMSETARRIRILRELYRAGSLSVDEISRLYSGASMMETRFDRLLATGQLEMREDRYVGAGRLLYAAACVVRVWRLVLGFDRGAPRKVGRHRHGR
jgi:hypothetical protein